MKKVEWSISYLKKIKIQKFEQIIESVKDIEIHFWLFNDNNIYFLII